MFGRKNILEKNIPKNSIPLEKVIIEKKSSFNREEFYRVKEQVYEILIDIIDVRQLNKMPEIEARDELYKLAFEIFIEKKINFVHKDIVAIINQLIEDILGLGPLSKLLDQDDINDILVIGYDKVYCDRNGIMELTKIKFQSEEHLIGICQKIAENVNRRVDESSPLCDCRLDDGSRVNIVFPPISHKGAALTIRKFRKSRLTFENLINMGSISEKGGKLLEIAIKCKCNIIISGGTGSGKTTLLNCLTQYIDEQDRIIACEDVAELQLMQKHVVSLETRPPNLEGVGEITMRNLVKNALRMRPERIIVGEVRGAEAFDLLQAMNTGHSGSMGTLHANSPRDGTSRLENMVLMSGYNLPIKVIREQITSAINIIIQTERLKDGSKKITSISEIVGIEGDVIQIQELLFFNYKGEIEGKICGNFEFTGIRPKFYEKAKMYGLGEEILLLM